MCVWNMQVIFASVKKLAIELATLKMETEKQPDQLPLDHNQPLAQKYSRCTQQVYNH